MALHLVHFRSHTKLRFFLGGGRGRFFPHLSNCPFLFSQFESKKSPREPEEGGGKEASPSEATTETEEEEEEEEDEISRDRKDKGKFLWKQNFVHLNVYVRQNDVIIFRIPRATLDDGGSLAEMPRWDMNFFPAKLCMFFSYYFRAFFVIIGRLQNLVLSNSR